MPVLTGAPSVGSVFNLTVGPLPSGDTTGATDTARLQAAINATPTGGTLWLPPGTFYTDQLTISHQMAICGLSGASGTLDNSLATPANHVDLQAIATATSPLINIAPASLEHHFQMENIGVDLTNATTVTGIYCTKIDNSLFRGVKVRDGACGFQFDNVQQIWVDKCMSFNQRTRGYYSSHASNVSLKFNRCLYYQSSGATWACTAGWDLASGASFMFDGCEALRATGGTGNNLSYGLRSTTAATTTFLFLTDTWFDAVTDGSGANSANSAAMYLSGAVNVRASACFFSANQSGAQKQRAVRINGGADISLVNCTLSGSGLAFVGSPDRVIIDNCNFPQAFSDPAIAFESGATPTNVIYGRNTLGGAANGITSIADAAQFNTSTNGANTDT